MMLNVTDRKGYVMLCKVTHYSLNINYCRFCDRTIYIQEAMGATGSGKIYKPALEFGTAEAQQYVNMKKCITLKFTRKYLSYFFK